MDSVGSTSVDDRYAIRILKFTCDQSDLIPTCFRQLAEMLKNTDENGCENVHTRGDGLRVQVVGLVDRHTHAGTCRDIQQLPLTRRVLWKASSLKSTLPSLLPICAISSHLAAQLTMPQADSRSDDR